MSTTAARPDTDRPTRLRSAPVLIVAALAVVIVVAALVLVEGSATYPAGSPEAAAQGYLQALLDDDTPTARRFVAPELTAGCEPATTDPFWRWAHDSIRFTAVTADATHAVLDLEFSGAAEFDILDVSRRSTWRAPQTGELQLERRNGDWLVVGASWIPIDCIER